MGASTKLRWKRYLNEMRYMAEEKDFVRAIIKDTGPEFEKYCKHFCKQNNIDFEELQQRNLQRLQELQQRETPQNTNQHPQLETEEDSALILHESFPDNCLNSEPTEEWPPQSSDYQMTQDEAEIHEAFNRLFKKVAMAIHPDKLSSDLTKEEKDVKLNMFRESKKAIEERKYFPLLDTAEKLRIALPRNYKQQIQWMKKELQMWKEANKKDKSTFNYLFSECETDQQRDNLALTLLLNIFGPQIFHTNP